MANKQRHKQRGGKPKAALPTQRGDKDAPIIKGKRHWIHPTKGHRATKVR